MRPTGSSSPGRSSPPWPSWPRSSPSWSPSRPCPNWAADALMILAAIPCSGSSGASCAGGLHAGADDDPHRGASGRAREEHVQIRLQRITEISLSQKLWERVVGPAG
jgi:hypothetical protein